MHANLGPGERLGSGAGEAAAKLLEDPRVAAVLVPLRPEGAHALARAARAYLAAWDRRFVHRQNHFLPAGRVVTRGPLPGFRSADAAHFLADAIREGRFVEALPEHAVATPIARDLDAWLRAFEAEGRAWGRLAARDPRFPPFLPARSWRGWARHNLRQAPRRVIEVLEAVRRPAPLVLTLHHVREAAWTAGCVRGWREAAQAGRPPE